MSMTDEGIGAPTRRQFVAAGAALAALAAVGATGCAKEEPAPAPKELSAALGSPSPKLPLGQAVDPAALSLLRHVAEAPYGLDPHTFEPYAALAAGAPVELSPTEYEVTLREGAAFPDGSPVTAEAVAAAFEGLRKANSAYAALLAPFEAVEAAGEATVRLTLAHPLPLLLQQRLSLLQALQDTSVWSAGEGPVAPEALQGSGPWALDAVDAEAASMRFVPNQAYTGPQAAGAPAMEWRFLAEGRERLAALGSFEVLVADDLPVEGDEAAGVAGTTQEWVPGFASPFLMFHCEQKPFSDVRVRQALLYAIDYDLVIAEVFGGHATAPTGVLPVTHRDYVRAKTVYSHDVERARTLLRQAGAEELELRLALQDEGMRGLADRVVADWAQVGVTAEITAPSGGLAASAAAYDVALCFDDPTLLGFDVDLILTWRYGGTVVPERLAHWEGSSAVAARRLMQQARESADAAEQKRLWEQCFEIISQQVPLYPIAFLHTGTAWRTDAMRDFLPLTTDGIDFLGVTLR